MYVDTQLINTATLATGIPCFPGKIEAKIIMFLTDGVYTLPSL